MSADLFRLDHAYDRDRASNGHSRYGAYLLDRYKTFEEIATDYDYDDGLTVPFAAAAWRIANGPIMSPPFVQSPKRVQGVQLQRSDWNGQAVVNVELVADRPQAWRSARTAGGGWYRDWSVDSWGDYESVGSRELEHGAYLLTTAQVLFQVPPGTLPSIASVPKQAKALYEQAVECLNAVIGVLNGEIGPLLGTPDRAGGRS